MRVTGSACYYTSASVGTKQTTSQAHWMVLSLAGSLQEDSTLPEHASFFHYEAAACIGTKPRKLPAEMRAADLCIVDREGGGPLILLVDPSDSVHRSAGTGPVSSTATQQQHSHTQQHSHSSSSTVTTAAVTSVNQ